MTFFNLCVPFVINTVHSDDHMDEHLLNILISESPSIKIKAIEKDNIIKGSFSGIINKDTKKSFLNFSVNCDLVGRAYTGRAFSCGFSEVEDLKAYCDLSSPSKKNSLMIFMECNTTAGFNGDAICKGKSQILQGYGDLSGVMGFGTVEMPLTKTLLKKNSTHPMKMSLKIKYPLSLKKTTQLENKTN